MSSNNLNLDQDFSFTDKIAYFIQKKRTMLFLILGILMALLIAGGIISQVLQNANEKKAVSFYEYETVYSDYMSADEEKKAELFESLKTEYDKLILMSSDGFYYERASYLYASASVQEEDYEKGLELYISILETGSSYLVPLSFINASAVLELQGKTEEAYNKLSDLFNNYEDQYYDKPHVLFSMGRLQESLGNNEEALKNYKLLSEDFSSSNWTKIAINRILFLED